MSKTKTKYTDDAIMQLITSGTTTKLEELTILWKDDRHVLVKFAGGKYWAGIGMEGYAPMRVEIRSFRNSKRTGRAVHEGGRLTKAILEKLIAKAKRATLREILNELTEHVPGPSEGRSLIVEALSLLREEKS